MEVSNLSNNDSNVLSALFDPESSLSRNAHIDDRQSVASDVASLQDLRQQEQGALRSIDTANPVRNDIEQAVSRLSEIIETHPSYGSAWVNRAQARRLLYSTDRLTSQPLEVQRIFQDLSEAVRLSTPQESTDMVSRANAQVLSSAHTHRGYLLLLASKSEENRAMLNSIPTLNSLSTQDLEEAASREFTLGGRYGNETARQLAVMTNPYAKLCGSIVKEALTKEVSDYYQLHAQLAS